MKMLYYKNSIYSQFWKLWMKWQQHFGVEGMYPGYWNLLRGNKGNLKLICDGDRGTTRGAHRKLYRNLLSGLEAVQPTWAHQKRLESPSLVDATALQTSEGTPKKDVENGR